MLEDNEFFALIKQRKLDEANMLANDIVKNGASLTNEQIRYNAGFANGTLAVFEYIENIVNEIQPEPEGI